jgi:acetyltransferase-like isoleucine patch superfamily enzyme
VNFNLFKFWLKVHLFGFSVANNFIQLVDKESLYIILKRYGASIGENCDIETGITFHNSKNYQNLTIGDNCHIGKHCFFDLKDKINIGNNVTISMQCTFITHQDMGNSSLVSLYTKSQSAIFIGNDVYIGARVTLLQGISIGKEVVIAAGSLVNNNAKERTIVGGSPARFIKEIKNF